MLFMDEPTSGLDSHAAMNVMKLTRGLCDTQGQTIVCSIHQPRPGIYKMFDQLLLLHQGRVVFSGSASDAMTFFTTGLHSVPFIRPVLSKIWSILSNPVVGMR